MIKKIVGIDPSTFTGMCLLEGDQKTTRLLNFPELKEFKRLQVIAQSVDNLIMEWSPDLAVVEGYAYGNVNTLVTLVEIGTLIRMSLFRRGIPWYDAPPSLLKRFTTGKGNSKKAEMAQAVKARWGFESKSDDVVDAYALARLGQVLASGDQTFLKGVSYHGTEQR